MLFETLQIRGSGGRVVTAPQFEMIDRLFGRNVEGGQGRFEGSTLEHHEPPRRPSQPLEEGQLELKLDPHVPDVADRAAEPRIESMLAGSGDPVDDPIWTCCSRLGVHRFGQPGIDQTIEGSINQGSPHRDHPSYLGIRLKCLGDGEAVCRSLGEKTEDGVLGE